MPPLIHQQILALFAGRRGVVAGGRRAGSDGSNGRPPRGVTGTSLAGLPGASHVQAEDFTNSRHLEHSPYVATGASNVEPAAAAALPLERCDQDSEASGVQER